MTISLFKKMERMNVKRTIPTKSLVQPAKANASDETYNSSQQSKIHKRGYIARFRVQTLNICSFSQKTKSFFAMDTIQPRSRAVSIVVLTVLILMVMSTTSSSSTSSWSLLRASHKYGLTNNFIPDTQSTLNIRTTRIQFHTKNNGQQLFKEAGYTSKPLVMGYYFDGLDSDTFRGSQYLDPNMKRRLTDNIVEIPKREIHEQIHLENSIDYEYGLTDPFEVGDCVAQYKWQIASFPTCNKLHETDLTKLSAIRKSQQDKKHNNGNSPVQVSTLLLSNGYWRDVWLTRSHLTNTQKETIILKTLRWEHEYEDRNYDRHRRDAVSMEHLTSSPRVIDIYGYCGNSGLSEFAPGGDIELGLWGSDHTAPQGWNETEVLIVAYQVAKAIADMHNFDKEGVASMAHTDITPSQFVNVDGIYKLNDFNRVRFIRWNKRTKEPCPFHVGNNPGNFRAPEEYEYQDESEKIDVYSMGNIFYTLVTQKWPFEALKESKAKRRVKRGERPVVEDKILSNNITETKVLLQAMNMCWTQDPKERATARQVENYLNEELEKLNIKEE